MRMHDATISRDYIIPDISRRTRGPPLKSATFREIKMSPTSLRNAREPRHFVLCTLIRVQRAIDERNENKSR